MKKFRVVLTHRASKQFRRLPAYLQAQCRAVMTRLSTEPDLGRPLVGPLSRYRSLRLHSYRLIYQKEGKVLRILMVSIRHRREVYRKLEA